MPKLRLPAIDMDVRIGGVFSRSLAVDPKDIVAYLYECARANDEPHTVQAFNSLADHLSEAFKSV